MLSGFGLASIVVVNCDLEEVVITSHDDGDSRKHPGTPNELTPEGPPPPTPTPSPVDSELFGVEYGGYFSNPVGVIDHPQATVVANCGNIRQSDIDIPCA